MEPIETAPKDGTEIVAWSILSGFEVVAWSYIYRLIKYNDKAWCMKTTVDDEGTHAVFEAPTHWMPLPEEPD